MLFLAVFCGFLAEYQLEHKIEKERVNKLMHDMVENLKYDSTRITRNTPENILLKNNLDSLRFEIKEAIQGNVNTNRLYYLFLKTDEFGYAAFNKAAMTQLKSSGLLRMVKNKTLLNEMLDYYERRVEGSEDYKDEVLKAMEVMREKGAAVLRSSYFDFVRNASDSAWNTEMMYKYRSDLNSVLTMQGLSLLSTDPADLEKLNSAALKLEWSIINYNRFLRFALEGARNMIHLINKYY